MSGSHHEQTSLLREHPVAVVDEGQQHQQRQRAKNTGAGLMIAAVLGLACTGAVFVMSFHGDIVGVVRLALGKPKRASFIHIPKAGGDTFRFTAANMGVPTEGEERCYQYMYRDDGDAFVNAVLIRDPRAHVLSQFSHCYTNPYETASLAPAWGFPRGDQGEPPPQRWRSGLDTWLSHFNSWHQGTDGYFNCYNPINMQARYLTCGKKERRDRLVGTGAERWGTPAKPRNPFYFQSGHYMGVNDKPEPDLPTLKARLDTMQVVGVTEAMKESLCLLEFKSRGAIHPGCECGSRAKLLPWRVETHGRIHAEFKTLPAEVMRSVYNITRVDRLLHRMAAQRLMTDVEDAEKRLGKTFMCAEGRRALEEIVGDEEVEHELVGSLGLDWDTWDSEAAKIELEEKKKNKQPGSLLTVAEVVSAAAAAAAGRGVEENVAATGEEEEREEDLAPAMSREKKEEILEAAVVEKEEENVKDPSYETQKPEHTEVLTGVPQLVPAPWAPSMGTMGTMGIGL